MKKTAILATAIAAIVAAPASFAAAHGSNSTVYGILHNSIDIVDQETGADNVQVNDRSSRLGFKGSEDLGNGMKAVYQMEFAVTTDGGNGTTAGGTFGTRTRNTFVGLAGDFGTVLMGRHDTPDKAAFYAAGNDHLGDSVVDLNGSFGFEENRVNNAIAYISNDMNGLKFAVAIIPGEGNGTTTGDGFADGTSVGVMYKSGPIKFGLGIHDKEDVTGQADDTLTNVGGSYTMGDLTLGLQYQTAEEGTQEDTAIAFVAKYAMGKAKLIASFGTTEADVGGTATDTTVMNLAYANSLSKRTTAYVGYSSTSDDVAVVSKATTGGLFEGSIISAGIVHKF